MDQCLPLEEAIQYVSWLTLIDIYRGVMTLMAKQEEHITSREFAAPFVRVRGRLSRHGQVQWSPCLRTFREPRWIGAVAHPSIPPAIELSVEQTGPGIVQQPADYDYMITFEDGQGNILARAPTEPEFFAQNQEWAGFGQRLPYRRNTERVTLRRGEKELGALHVTRQLPEFALLYPLKAEQIDSKGVLHLRWEADPVGSKKHPLTFYVRFSADGKQWLRPGVNLKSTEFDLDLREMPGGNHCVVQVIATNGYQTAFAETPTFQLPRKLPELLLGDTSGPVLFAQGFSREEGPIVGESIVWLADDKKQVGSGATFDARRLRSGVHQITVRIKDQSGAMISQVLGVYDGETGLLVPPKVGL